ncbi:MAG: 4Fe-4S binding protein [Desulfitobacterium sp.]|nr:4Fe-4S binding protein [Desulfitobacterium sp.]
MKIAVLSGKGGTGKTLVSVNLASVAKTATYIDCDVEEPNGHLFFKPKNIQQENVAVTIPQVDSELCSGCRKCVDFCKFNALAYIKGNLLIFEDVCHSCGGCIILCPEKALSEKERVIGKIQKGNSDQVTIYSGILNTGEANGTPIIKKLLNISKSEENKSECNKSECNKSEQEKPALDQPDELTIIDCPPGSACIVMDSIKDADYCVLVAEPTIFGTHNLNMVFELVQIFNKRFGVVLNKCQEGENPAKDYVLKKGIKILGEIPFDHELGKLNSNGEIIAKEKEEYRQLFSSLLEKIKEDFKENKGEVHHETASSS